MAGTFGSQLAQQQAQQQQGALSRTQRKNISDQDMLARAKFEGLKKDAEKIQKEEFIDKPVQEKYTEEIPDWDRIRDWGLMRNWESGRIGDRQMRQMLDAWRRQGLTTTVQRTRTVIDPFTFDDYTKEYAKLSDDLKQFFASPQAITDEKNRKIQVEKDTFQQQLKDAQSRLANAQKHLQDLRDWYNNLQGDRRHRNRDSFDRQEREYELDIQQYQEVINQAQAKFSMIDQGATANDIINYAEDYADYNRRRRESKDRAREQFKKDVKTGKISEEQLLKLNLTKESVDYNKYINAVEKYNANVDYVNTLRQWAGKVGVEKLPTWAREKIGASSDKEILIFNQRGEVTGIKSATFGGTTFSVDQYNAKVKEEQAKYDKLSTMDTTLKLGESKPNYAVMSSADKIKPLSEEQQAINRKYADKSFLEKGFDFVKGIFVGDKVETTTTPPMEFITTTTAPQGMGGKGTVITTTTLTPESNLYVNEMGEFTGKADKLSEEIFADYEKKISELKIEDITPEKLSAIKTEQQNKFNTQIGVYSGEFSKDFSEGMKKISREQISLLDAMPFGTQARKWYYKQEDKDIAGRNVAVMDLDKNTYTLKNDDLFAKQNFEQEAKSFSLQEKKYGTLIARELSSIQDFGKGTIEGTYKAVKYNPRTFLIKTGLWTGAIAGATVISAYTGGFGGVATSSAVKWAGKGLITLYGGSVVVRTAMPSTAYERGLTLGSITGTEILPMGIGGVTGTYLGGKAIAGMDYAYYKWIKKYPYRTSYKLTEMEQLRGKAFTRLKKGETQKQAFKKLDKDFTLPDERALLKQGGKLQVGTHATASRSAFKGDKTVIQAQGREINAMSIANKRMSMNFLDIRKSPKYSFYSGTLPTGSMPLGLRIDVKGLRTMPKGFKPKLTLKELEKILGAKINPKYFKQTAFLYEKGKFGVGYSVGKYGLKSEVEKYLKGFGDLKRTAKQKYYTRIASEKFYEKLEGFRRKGYQEFGLRVQKFSLLKPSTYVDKILSRKAGTFKPMTKGRVVPYERFEALATGDKNLQKQIKALLSNKDIPRAKIVDILKEQRVAQVSSKVSSSSVGGRNLISASYPPSYAIQLLSYPRSSRSRSPSVSYSQSYSNLKSSIKSIISSSSSSISRSSKMSSAPSSMISSSISADYYSGGSYSGYSLSYNPPRSYPKLPSKSDILREKIRKKFKPTPEFEALFPDFTARSLGIAPTRVKSVKEALREISKLQTGFEVRTGARLKGYSPIDEKSLMRGIMK
jgi:hypothetical protein